MLSTKNFQNTNWPTIKLTLDKKADSAILSEATLPRLLQHKPKRAYNIFCFLVEEYRRVGGRARKGVLGCTRVHESYCEPL